MRIGILLVSVLACLTEAKAETITVCSSGCQFGNIQSAIDASSNGDVIAISAGTYPLWATISTNGKSIVIRGAVDGDGVPITVLDGRNQLRVLQCRNGEGPTTVFQNLVIQNGRSSDGAGIYIDNASPTINNCHVRQNRSTFSVGGGGGIYLINSGAHISDCLIYENYSQYRGGGIILWSSNATVVNCTIRNNHAIDGGGGVCVSGAAPVFELCGIRDNTSSNNGGGLFLVGDLARFTNCEIRNNTGSAGGAIHAQINSRTSLTNCTITTNVASSNGGAASIVDSSPRFLGCALRSNNGGYAGGGLSIAGVSSSPFLQSTTVCGNAAVNGAQVFIYQGGWENNAGNCVVDDCVDCVDFDGDGIGDAVDNCPLVFNPSQADCDNDGIGDACEPGEDYNGNGVPDYCECIADLFGDGVVDGVDLGALLAYWGPTTSSSASQRSDLNRDGAVDGNDLGYLLSRWGPCTN